MIRICDFCKKEYESSDKRRLTCSWECRNKRLSKKMHGIVFTEDHKKNISINHHNVSGKNNPRWKGGTRILKTGYVLIYSPNHPYKTKWGYVFEHRLVMEKKIGRYLLPNEVVHHIDGNKTNNKIENLLIMSPSEHHRLHQEGKKKRVTSFCNHCGIKFDRTKYALNRHKNHYCSRSCYFLEKRKHDTTSS